MDNIKPLEDIPPTRNALIMQWSVTGQMATLDSADWQWSLDMSQPNSGVACRYTCAQSRLMLGHLLKVNPIPGHACQIDDWFARGSDLMVRYGQSNADQFAFQLDYRAVPSADSSTGQFLSPGKQSCGLDIWLSVQTQLLDSYPTLELSNQVSDSQWKAFDGDGLAIDGDASLVHNAVGMLTCQSQRGSIAILIHPSDQPQTELLTGEGITRLRLFGNFMEKGVIRRARVRCLVCREQLDARTIQQVYEDFADSPLPLTT
ncbi:MAG: hypothetical protein IT423_06740 [Pirellulaceae bacterium]|nr:hypothetical protein [Pirellulaceae bacterium]